MNYRIISAVLVLALASLACGFSFNLPKSVEPGPDITEPISVDAPASGTASLSIAFGAGDLKLSPGAQGKLVEGTAVYNIKDLKPEVQQSGGTIEIRQGDYKFDDVATLNKIKNQWDLKLGSTPMDLSVKAGAYHGTMELGGLSLSRLMIKDGAADSTLSFESPNTVEMSVLNYETGASNVNLRGLANANFNTMVFKGGAGQYDIDFGGTLQHEATASITCGFGDLTLRIPKTMNAVLTVQGGLHNVNLSSGWSQNGTVYTQQGSGPTLTLLVDMSAGNLTITD